MIDIYLVRNGAGLPLVTVVITFKNLPISATSSLQLCTACCCGPSKIVIMLPGSTPLYENRNFCFSGLFADWTIV